MKQSLCLALVLAAAACGQPAESVPPASPSTAATAGWNATEGIATPESAYFDPASGFVFSSQIDGQPDGRDGNGRIVKIAGDGTVVDAAWVTGLHAPKGLRACGGTLWTADIDAVVGISVATGGETARVTIPDAQFLNDVACEGDAVYVSDMMGNRIYRVRNGEASVFAEGEALEYPNGLLVDGGRLVVGSWGRPGPDFSTEVPGRLYALDLATGAKTLITPDPFANIDGVESDGRGGYLISDYLAGTIQQVGPDGSRRVIRESGVSSADIGVVPGTGIVIVPHMNENRVAAYDLASALD